MINYYYLCSLKKLETMAKINLDTEPRFKAMMKELGFKKTKGEFIMTHNEACISLSFPYAAQNEKK